VGVVVVVVVVVLCISIFIIKKSSVCVGVFLFLVGNCGISIFV